VTIPASPSPRFNYIKVNCKANLIETLKRQSKILGIQNSTQPDDNVKEGLTEKGVSKDECILVSFKNKWAKFRLWMASYMASFTGGPSIGDNFHLTSNHQKMQKTS
jgi:hypothetical protein